MADLYELLVVVFLILTLIRQMGATYSPTPQVVYLLIISFAMQKVFNLIFNVNEILPYIFFLEFYILRSCVESIFELIFVRSVIQSSNFILNMNIQLSVLFIAEIIFSSIWEAILSNNVFIQVRVYFWGLNSIPLAYMSVFFLMPLPYCFDCYNLEFSLIPGSVMPPALFFLQMLWLLEVL